jgi:hypothetical protein
MAMKDFDWKKFMVEKGERVALAAAGLLTLILLAVNVRSIFSAGPAKNADVLKTKTRTLSQALQTNRPKDSDLPVKSDDLMRSFAFTYINEPSRYEVAPLFPASGRVDEKRLQPRLYTPVEGKVAVIQGQLWSYILRKNDKTGNLEIKVKDAPTGMATPMQPMQQTGRDTTRREAYRNLGQPSSGRGNLGVALERGSRTGGAPLLGDTSSGQFADPGAEVKARFVPTEQLNELNNAILLNTVRPIRMTEIVASFPYKKEVEEFRAKLKKLTAQEVLEEDSREEVEVPADDPTATAAPQKTRLEAFRFLGVVVERRQVDRQGKVLFPEAGPHKDNSGWEPIDVTAEYKPLLVLSNLQLHPEDEKLDDVKMDGLVMPLLRSTREKQYPEIEVELPTIANTLKAMETEKKKTGAVLATSATNFNPDRFEAFRRQQSSQNMTPGGMGPQGTERGMMGPPRRMLPGGIPGGRRLGGPPSSERGTGSTPLGDKLILPEYVLVRIVDVTIKPGESYQYRLRVRMANPNYHREDCVYPQDAENLELKPNPDDTWFQISGIVTVPTDLHYYALDQKVVEKDYKGGYKDATVGRDQTVIQIQKYLDNIDPVPGKNVPVGEWSVAERVIVGRGEIIDRRLRVEVPLLVEEEEKWKLASTPGDKGRDPGINVPFDGIKGRPAVLVDFERGRKTHRRLGGDEVRDDPGEEVLILAPDGKLLAHNAAVDAGDKDRQEMLKAWRERIEQVKKDNSDPMNPNQGGIRYNSFGQPIGPGPGGPMRGGPGDGRRN